MGDRNTINANIGSDFGIEEYSNAWVADSDSASGTIADWTRSSNHTAVDLEVEYGAVGLHGGGAGGETATATTDNSVFGNGRQISFSVGGLSEFRNTSYDTSGNIAYGEVLLVDTDASNTQSLFLGSASNPASLTTAGYAGGFAYFVLTLSEDGDTVNVRSGGNIAAGWFEHFSSYPITGAGTATLIADGTDIDVSSWVKPIKLKLIAKGQGGRPKGTGDIWCSPIITNKSPYVISSKRQEGKYSIT